MNYIFLIAGKGTRLHPITLDYPKSLYKLDDQMTVFERMIALIQESDPTANIVAVTGFQHQKIEAISKSITYVYNPFYEVTNSIASLWFAEKYMDGDTVLINGDIVMERDLVQNVLCAPINRTEVLLDRAIKQNGDYNVQVNADNVVVMSKQLDEYYGEYAGVTRISASDITQYKKSLDAMIDKGVYTCWHEDLLVQMIFRENFSLGFCDIAQYEWTEIDCVSDLVNAKKIQSRENFNIKHI